MMKRVPIASADNSGAETLDGRTIGVIGGGRVAAGDVAWSMGDFAFSPGRPGGRAPIVWAENVYRFADAGALIMYYVDKKIKKVLKTKNILPPIEGAALVLHCYNRTREYLVWFVGDWGTENRFIIQKNGQTIADFVSGFSYMPEEVDAYVDDNGDLIWGAAGYRSGIITITAFKNGETTKTASYQEDQIVRDYEVVMRDRMANRPHTATVTPGRTETTTDLAITISGVSGQRYWADHAGTRLEVDSQGAYGSLSAAILYDLFNADAFIGVYGDVTGYVYQDITAEVLEDGGWVDSSRSVVLAVGQLRATKIFRASTGETIAEWQTLDDGAWVEENATYRDRGYDEYEDEPTDTTIYAAGTPTTTVVRMGSPVYGNARGQGQVGLYGVEIEVRCVSGPNAGAVRVGTITGAAYSGALVLVFSFSVPWEFAPVVGDAFIAGFRFGTRTLESGFCTIDAAITPDDYNIGPTGPIVDNLGNGYTASKTASVGNVYGWVSVAGAITYNEQKIYDAPEQSLLLGAYRTAPRELLGVVGWTALSANGSTVTEIDPPFNPSNIVTKRFA